MIRSAHASFLCRFLLAVALGGSLLAQGVLDAESKLEMVKDFRSFYRRNKEVSQRVEAIMTLADSECPAAAKELVKLLSDRVERIRATAMTVITGYKEVATFQEFLDGLEGADNLRKALMIEVLGKAGIQQSLPVLGKVGRQKGIDSHVKVALAEALRRLKDGQDNNDVLKAFLADADPVVRIAATETVGGLRIKPCGDALVPLLGDKDRQVQSAAIKAVGQVRVEKAIDPLIELMRLEGRFKIDTAEALFLITMKDYGLYPDQWAKSIRELRGFGWKMPTDAQVAKAKAARQKNAEYYGAKSSGKKTFGGIVTTSTRVLFIIDVSGSMEHHVTEKKKFGNGYDDFAKLTIVKTELANTIESLDRNTFFNVVAFATDLKLWKKDLRRADVVSRDNAIRWVKRLKPIGGTESAGAASAGLSSDLSAGKTNTFKALMYPFNINPDKEIKQVFTGGASRKLIKSKLDTVYFLSDGRPSVGKYVDTELILEEVRKVNKVYQMTFHTIAIGHGVPKTFLRTLAIENGGEFVDLGF